MTRRDRWTRTLLSAPTRKHGHRTFLIADTDMFLSNRGHERTNPYTQHNAENRLSIPGPSPEKPLTEIHGLEKSDPKAPLDDLFNSVGGIFV